jgi:DnaK suppressor protein
LVFLVNLDTEAIVAQESYNPLIDSLYMSPQMKQFFKQKLEEERERLSQTASFYALSPDFDTCHSQADPLDQSTMEHLSQTHHAFYTHENLLSRQIERALQRLASGSYGYCIISGNPIGVERLMAAPYTAYFLDVQEEQEKMKSFSGLSNTASYLEKQAGEYINDRL